MSSQRERCFPAFSMTFWGFSIQSLGFHYELIGTGFQLGRGWGV